MSNATTANSRTPWLSALMAIAITLPAAAQNKAADPFEEGMRQAFADYKKGDNEAVTAKLRELLKIVEDKSAKGVENLLPDQLGPWRGESIQRGNLAVVGGGFSMTRVYVQGPKSVTVRIVKDSPVAKGLIPLLTNDELIRASNRKTHRISGETAIMDGETKLQMVVDGRIFVELEGKNGAAETDLVTLARQLDLTALGKLK